ncbi:MAG TPA: hypothetical protein VMH50_09270 [Thermoleophilia bacterium]|nr:hypothetical protein [Thermoleophilia bacterium]
MSKKTIVSLASLAIVVALAGGLALLSHPRTAEAIATAPIALADVPSTIPASGASVDGGFILLKPHTATASESLLSQEQALQMARDQVNGDNAPEIAATAVLADVTISPTLPFAGDDPSSYANIQGRPSWIVTFTSPEPFDCYQGMVPLEGTTAESPVFMVTHSNAVLDAQTGQFLWGFYTK